MRKNDYSQSESLDPDDLLEKDKRPLPVPWDEMKKWELPAVRWRIKNLIPAEGLVILAAISGECKSWLALLMAKCIALGENFLGKDQFETKGGNVLYIDLEMPKSEMLRRGKQMELSEENHRLFILNHDDMNLYDDDYNLDRTWLMRFIEENNIQTVFVDTFRPAAGGIREEKAEEVRTFFNNFMPLKNKGVSVVFLDHLRKPARWEGKVPQKSHLFSSQDKAASVEVLLMIRSEEGSGKISFYQRKNRLDVEIKPFTILMKDEINEQGEKKTVFEYGEEIEDSESKKEQAKELVPNILESGGRTRKEILEIVQEEAKMGERNISDALRELCDAGVILKSKKGRQNYYTLPESENTSEIDTLKEQTQFL